VCRRTVKGVGDCLVDQVVLGGERLAEPAVGVRRAAFIGSATLTAVPFSRNIREVAPPIEPVL
jgi:hypothetical protein